MDSIEISVFRVSPDGKNLEMIFSCPEDFYFSSFMLEVKTLGDKDQIVSQFFDLSPALFINTVEDPTVCPTVYKKEWSVILPLEKLGITEPAMYNATFKAEYMYDEYGYPFLYNDQEVFHLITEGDYKGYIRKIDEEEVFEDCNGPVKGHIMDDCETVKDELEDFAFASDVNFVFRCLLDGLMLDRCNPVPDDVIRNYLILYGHMAAVAEKDFETAEYYFKVLAKCFKKCGEVSKNPIVHSPCNCH